MLINPAALLDTLRAVPGVDEFQVVLTRQDPEDPFSMDEMAVRVRPRAEFTTADAIYDPARQAKPERLVDRR